MNSGIYKITNKINNKFYIGSTVNLNIRKGKHFRDLRANRHDNNRLQKSFNKYGENTFIFETIVLCPIEYLVKLEQWFLINMKPYYNILLEAYSSLGYKHTPETIEKFKEKRKGKIPIEAAIASAKKRSKIVYQYNLFEKLVDTHLSTKQAAKKTGFVATNIAACCREKLKVYKGFKWRYFPT